MRFAEHTVQCNHVSGGVSLKRRGQNVDTTTKTDPASDDQFINSRIGNTGLVRLVLLWTPKGQK